MAYTPPNKATFIGIFPAFAAVQDEAYAFWSARAGRVVNGLQACLADDADLAAMLITAHLLTLQGIGSGAEAEMAAQGASGFKRIKSGTIDLERADNTSAASMGEYGATSYGQQVWPMLKACVAGPRVTGTGSLPNWPCSFNGWAGPIPPWGQ